MFAAEGSSDTNAFVQCIECHQKETESFQLTEHAQLNQCSICHGDEGRHLSEQGESETIMNLRNLSVSKSNDICLRCHSEKEQDIREKFKAAATLHDPFRCFDCHIMHAQEVLHEEDEKSFRADLSVDCAVCHRRNDDNLSNSPHGFSGMVCADCHKLHETKTISRDIEEQITTCLSCHPTQELEFKNIYAHPLRERQIKCSDCHDPHNARYEKMLTAEEDDVCAKCHENIIIEGGRHPLSEQTDHPLKRVQCMDCHEPHGGNFNQLLRQDVKILCKTCHN